MKIVKPSFKIEWGIKGTTKKIERAARNCYKSEDRICEGSDIKLIKSLIDRNHKAMFEFGDICISFITDRGISHELVRHRLASYAQESTRYCAYNKDKFDNQLTFVLPMRYYDYVEVKDDGSFNIKNYDDKVVNWLDNCADCERVYLENIRLGEKPEEVRDNLPNSLKTEIFMKCNITEWRHVFNERAINNKAHPHMRQLMIPTLYKLSKSLPVLFEDLIYKRDGILTIKTMKWAEDTTVYDLDGKIVEIGD